MDAGGIVKQFLDRWNMGIEETRTAFRDTLTADGVWNNVGLLVTTGPDECIAALDNFVAQMGFVRMGYTMVNFSVDGARVYTERVDRFFDKDGHEFLSLPVFGVFELNADGKIVQWRDYFDSKSLG